MGNELAELPAAGTSLRPAEANPCPDHLTVVMQPTAESFVLVGVWGASAVLLAGFACGAVVANAGQGPVLAFAMLSLMHLVAVVAAFRDWAYARGGLLALMPKAVTFTSRSRDLMVLVDQVTAVRWQPLASEVQLVTPSATVPIRLRFFAPADRDRIVTWVRRRWPERLHVGWSKWARRADLLDRVANVPSIGRDLLAAPDVPEPTPTSPTVRLDVHVRARAWVSPAIGTAFMCLMAAQLLFLPFVARPAQGAGNLILQIVMVAVLAAFPVGLIIWCLRQLIRLHRGRLVLDPDWIIYTCTAHTRKLAAADVVGVEWQQVFGQVCVLSADGKRLNIVFDSYPRAQQYAILTWIRGRFPFAIQKKWDEFPARRYLPPERNESRSPETALPFLYGRGLLRFLLIVITLSAVIGQAFGYIVQQQMPPGQPFVIDLPILGNRQLVLATPEDWALLTAGIGCGVAVAFLVGMRAMMVLAGWLSDDGDGNS